MMRPKLFQMDPFFALRNAVNRAIDEFPNMPEVPWLHREPAFPAINVWEDENNLYVEAEIPGVTADGLETSVVGRELTIKSTRTARQENNLTYHRQERGTGTFTRVLGLPVEVETAQVQATLKDGVLSLTLPKARTAKSHKIEVKAG